MGRWLAVVALCGAAGAAVAASPWDDAAVYSRPRDLSPTSLQERRLVQGLIDVRQGRLERALDNLTGLVERQPDFGLAQLVYGDLLTASAGRLAGFGHHLAEGVLADYRQEARARIDRYLSAPPVDSHPDSILHLPEEVPAAIVVDLDRNRLFLFERRGQSGLVRTRDFYVSIGKGGIDKQREGDDKTPVGVYRVSGFLPESTLPDMYGDGALPLDYPNGWDRRRGRSGSGIWIHGTDFDRYSRPPLSSEGCVTLANEDFRALMKRIEVGGTPVVVAGGLSWVSRDEAREPLAAIERAVERWRRDWESLDTERYLAHYAADFTSGRMSRAAFADHKRRVNRSKSYVRVEIDRLEAYRYPGEPDLVLVRFIQRYQSDNFRLTRHKHQYWRRDSGAWRIVLEEAV